jgi:hypothetical protein
VSLWLTITAAPCNAMAKLLKMGGRLFGGLWNNAITYNACETHVQYTNDDR